MAGSFGYEAEHYDTSIAMAELSLMPAVRKAPADALIVADGTSCRHQIADGATDRRYTSPRCWRRRSHNDRSTHTAHVLFLMLLSPLAGEAG